VMWFHALKSKGVEASASEVNLPRLCNEAALDFTSGPEGMAHFPPWFRWIGTVRGDSVLPRNEAGGDLGELDVHYDLLARGRLDVVRVSVL
jgi:hypothetical protein